MAEGSGVSAKARKALSKLVEAAPPRPLGRDVLVTVENDELVYKEVNIYGNAQSDAAETGSAPDLNPSGITPTRFTVLVKPDKEPEFTKSGLALPPQFRDPRNAAAVTGTVLDIADEAFSFIADPGTRRPRIGDRIAFTKYAGMLVKGADGEFYKLMNDEDISAVLGFPFEAGY